MTFPSLSGGSCSVRCFDRHGGMSKGAFTSLNVGRLVGDDHYAVENNRLQVKTTIGAATLLSAKQVHGDRVYCLEDAPTDDMEIEDVDGLITNTPGIALMIQQADCQAVLFFDPIREVIAAVHCGWRGSVQDILHGAILKMQECYGSVPADLNVVISPSLGPCCAEFIYYQKELPAVFQQFMVKESYFDFWQISRFQLVRAGVNEKNIHTVGTCTSCNDDYFSYRRASRENNGMTGRNCSLILLSKLS